MHAPTDTAGDADLLERARRGDGEAFAAFYRRHERLVLGWLMGRTRDAALAADLAAEVFAAAHLDSERFRPEVAPAAAWLLGIARNKLHASRRRRQVEDRARCRLGLERLALDDAELTRVEACGSAVLEQLPPEQRDAVRARVVDEESYAEVAARLSTSAAVVRKRVSRGLAALRRRLAEEGANR